jgi:hypothetical protein
MARQSKPSPAELAAANAASDRARVDRDIEARDRLLLWAREPGDAEADRMSALQAKLGIIPFADYPGAASLLEIVRVLRGHLERIEDERALISVERYLSGAMSSAGVSPPQGAKAAEFTARRDKLRAKLQIDAAPPAPKAGELPASVVEALEVFRSDTAEKYRAPQPSRQTELQTMEIVVVAGLSDARAMLETLRGEAAYDQAKALEKRHGTLLVSVFRAGQQFAEAAAAERDLRTALTSAGYGPRSDVITAPGILGAILVLGDERDWASQISQFRRFLESRKLL